MGNMDHNACAFPALLNAKSFFDGLKGDCSWTGIEEQTTIAWSLSPNPSNGSMRLRSFDGNDVKIVWELLQVDGRRIANGTSRSTNGELLLNFLDVMPGTFLLKVNTGTDQHTLKVVLN